MTDDPLPPVLERMLSLWNGAPIDPAELYAPICVENGTSSFTPDDIARDIAHLRGALADLAFTVESWTSAGPLFLLRLVAEGLHTGTLETPLGKAEASGLRLRMSGLEVFEVRDDRITSVWLSWNWSAAYAKLGATLPAR